MAIKGKNRTKSKPKPLARAPRREPVIVKPPLPARRWVQVTAALLVGAFAFMTAVWVTNGLRQDGRDKDARAAAAAAHSADATRQTAGQTWKQTVEGAMSQVGTVDPTLTPNIFVAMNKAIDEMVKKDTVPPPAVKIFKAGAKSAKKAVDDLTNFDLTGTIKDKGFDAAGAGFFTESRDRLAAAIGLYQRAAEAALLAARAPDAERKPLAALADHLRSDANAQFQAAWTIYQSALGSAGIGPKAPTGLGSG
jgi:hypothetical protein